MKPSGKQAIFERRCLLGFKQIKKAVMTTCHNRLRYFILNVIQKEPKTVFTHHHAAGIMELIHELTAFLSEI